MMTQAPSCSNCLYFEGEDGWCMYYDKSPDGLKFCELWTEDGIDDEEFDDDIEGAEEWMEDEDE